MERTEREKQIVGAMRTLAARGVTHFVVSDQLYYELEDLQKRQNAVIGRDLHPGLTEQMTCNGKPILRERDIQITQLV
jgi:hypothetical protein